MKNTNNRQNRQNGQNGLHQKTLTKLIDNNETLDLNASEISVLCRNKFDFTNAVIVQKRGSNRTASYARECIEATGCTNFTLVFDLDASKGL